MTPGDPYISYAVLGIVSAALTTFSIVWIFVGNMIERAAKPAREKAETVSTEFAEYKVHVAETYMPRSGVREFRDEIMESLRDVKDNMRDIKDGMMHMSSRIDGMVDKPRRPTTVD